VTAPLESSHNETGIIDVHCHFLTERYVRAARKAGSETPDGMPIWPRWSVDDQLTLMADRGIQRSIVSVSSPGVHFGDDDAAAALSRHVNEFGAQLVAQHPTSFGFFAAVPLPDVDRAIDEAAFALDQLGANGIALMSNSAGQYLGDDALAPLWALLDERGAVAFIHPTSPPGADRVDLGRPRPMLEFMFETTRTVTDMVFAGVIERYPEVRFVIPHCGAVLPVVADRVELFRGLLPGPNGGAPSRLSARDQLQRCWFDLAGTPIPAQLEALLGLAGKNRLLYGSDFCFTPAPMVAHHIHTLDGWAASQNDWDWRSLTSRNANAVLGSKSRRGVHRGVGGGTAAP
jgi:6-methylsalicylate decarboxylase